MNAASLILSQTFNFLKYAYTHGDYTAVPKKQTEVNRQHVHWSQGVWLKSNIGNLVLLYRLKIIFNKIIIQFRSSSSNRIEDEVSSCLMTVSCKADFSTLMWWSSTHTFTVKAVSSTRVLAKLCWNCSSLSTSCRKKTRIQCKTLEYGN